MLLNIDKRLRTATLHSRDCRAIPHPQGTAFKPADAMGRDGGWFQVQDEQHARASAMQLFPTGEFIRCSHC